MTKTILFQCRVCKLSSQTLYNKKCFNILQSFSRISKRN